MSKSASQIPMPPGLPILGHALEMKRDILGMVTRARETYGDVMRFRPGPETVYVFCHPDDVEHVLKSPQIYNKDTHPSALIREMTGNSVLVSNGDVWAQQRRMMQPFFTVGRAQALCDMIVEYTNEMLEGWDARAKSGEPIDIASEMMRLTYRVIEKALFGTTTTEGMHEIEEAIGTSLECLYRRASSAFSAPRWLPTPSNRRYRRAHQTIDSRIHEIIEQHSAPGSAETADLLSCLMKATDDETNERMTPDQLRNEMVTLLIAGHETTANAMTWLWYHVSRHADVEQQLIDEAERVGDLNAESLSGLEYTAMVIRESMRIHPPIWISPRNTLQDDEVHGYLIPAKSAVALCQWTTHRHPDFWPDPETFDPGRFEASRMKDMHPFAYFPFGAGPRNCVGQHIAFTEALVITSMIARRFRLRLAPGHRVEVQPGITLRSKYGMRMLVEPLK